METKRCSTCNVEKSVQEFNTHKTKGYQASCKDCRAEYNRNRYLQKKERFSQSALEYKGRYREWYRSLKDFPCTDCRHKFPYYVMTWDHLPNQEKLYDIAALATQMRAKDVVLKEIEKCELVCFNCHAERTHNRRHRDMV